MVLVRLQHFGHLVVGGSTNGGHGGLRLLVGLDPDLVDPVRHVLLLRGFQRFRQGVIQDHPLLGIRLQLVDQHHLGRRLILQRIDPGLALFDIALQCLRLGQHDLFLLDQLVIAHVQGGEFGFQLGAGGGILFDRNLVLKLDDPGVHRADLGAHGLQLTHSRLAVDEGALQIDLDLGLLLVQHDQLVFQQAHDDVGFADQILQLIVDRGHAHAFLAHGIGLGSGKHADKAFPAGLGAHLVEIFGESGGYIVQPHDQFGDVGIHQIGVGMHLCQGRILDIHSNISSLRHLDAGRLDARGQFRDFALRGCDLLLAFADLGVEIGHAHS